MNGDYELRVMNYEFARESDYSSFRRAIPVAFSPESCVIRNS
jgi:hypothetical protein